MFCNDYRLFDNGNTVCYADLTKIYEGQAKEVKRVVANVDSHYSF
jgi:hypothetical protein